MTRSSNLKIPRSYAQLPIVETRRFSGLYSYPKPQQIPRGAAQDSLNFLTRGSWIETAGGFHPLGPDTTAAGKVLGIITAHTWDGKEIVFKADMTGALLYYIKSTNTYGEVGGTGAKILAAAATAGENVYMT